MKKEEIYNAPKYAGVYMFRNTINGKCYIGQSIKLRRRLLHHINNYEHDRYDAPIYRAFKKYGLENFELKILQTWHSALDYRTKQGLDFYEKQYIQQYNSLVPNGYNQTIGGDGGTEGYKFTEEQLIKNSRNAKKVQNDGRNTVYCYNITTGKVISAISIPKLATLINEKLTSSCLRNNIIKGNYIIARDKQLFQKKIATFKAGKINTIKPKITDEISEDIKAGMSEKEFLQKYNVCRKTYYNYRHIIFPDYKREYKTIIDLGEFKEYMKNHTVKECSDYFNISLRRAYKYRQKISTL